MRIVATSDTHFPVDPKSVPQGDVFILAGDMMKTGYLDEWKGCLDWLAKLQHKHKIFIPGNHDFHLQVYPGPAMQDLMRRNVKVIGYPGNEHYYKYVLPNGMILGGLSGVTGLPRWAFNMTEEDIEKHLKILGYVDVMVSHAPPFEILDQVFDKLGRPISVGSNALRNYIDVMKPKISIHGHIHESYGHIKHGETDCYNVAMCDRNYEQSNPIVIIDV